MKYLRQSKVDPTVETRYYHAYHYYTGSGDGNDVYGVRNGFESLIGWSSTVLIKFKDNISFDLSHHVSHQNEIVLIRYFI